MKKYKVEVKIDDRWVVIYQTQIKEAAIRYAAMLEVSDRKIRISE